MKKTLSILLALVMVLCVSCAFAEESTEDAGTFKITLTGNPTTGYAWMHVVSDETIASVEEAFLTSEDIDKLAGIEPQAEPTVGEGGLYVFTVKGLKPGTVVIAFEYGQSWDEQSTQAGLTFQLTVNEDLSVVCTACAMGM